MVIGGWLCLENTADIPGVIVGVTMGKRGYPLQQP